MKRFKKLSAWILTFFMALTLLPTMGTTVFADEVELGESLEVSATEIFVGDSLTIQVEGEEHAYFKFIPEETATYTFKSETDFDLNCDPYAFLLDEEKQELAFDDDGGYDLGFKLTAELEAGQTYYYAVGSYGDNGPQEITVSLINPANCLHSQVIEDAVIEPTCQAPGYTEGVYCLDCDTFISGHEEIAQLPHTDENEDNFCDVCKTLMQEFDPFRDEIVAIEFFNAHDVICGIDTYWTGIGANVTLADGTVVYYDFGYEPYIYNNSYAQLGEVLFSEYGLSLDGFPIYDGAYVAEEIGNNAHEIQLDFNEEEHSPVTYNSSININVVENPVLSISVEDPITVLDSNAYLEDPAIDMAIAQSIPVYVTYSDGTTKALECDPRFNDSVMEFNGESFTKFFLDPYIYGDSLSNNYDVYARARHSIEYHIGVDPDFWELNAGWTYPLTVKYMGATASVDMEVVEDPAYCKHKDLIDTEAVSPSCSTPGYTAGLYCNDCGEYLDGHEIIPRLPHTDADENGICDECGSAIELEIFVNEPLSVYVSGEDITYIKFVPEKSGGYILSSNNCGQKLYGYFGTESQWKNKFASDDGILYACADVEAGETYYWGAQFTEKEASDTLDIYLTYAPECQHNHIVEISALEATGYRPGHITYYICNECGNLFFDREATAVATLDEVTLPAIDYKVTYVLNGGTNDPGNPTGLIKNNLEITLQNPTREGCTFAGWYKDASFKTKVTTIAANTNSNVTFYAKWTPNTYKIAFSPNYDYSKDANFKAMASMTSRKYDTAYTLTANTYARKGYHFTGWNTKRDGSGESYADKASVQNLTATNGATAYLYAQWAPNTYRVAFSPNYEYKNDPNFVVMPSMTDVAYDTSYNLSANTYARTGYTFTGWNTKRDGSGTAYAEGAAIKNLTSTNNGTVYLYAQWKVNTYKIVFSPNYDYSKDTNFKAMASMTGRKYDVAYTLTANIYARKGYHFVGWNTKKDGSGKSYKDGASVKNLTATNGASVYLYAQWALNTYKVVFSPNYDYSNVSGFKAMPSMTGRVYGETYNLSANTYTRTGYTFTGWNTKRDGSGTSYANAAEFKNLTSTNGGSVYLYAQWRVNTYKIVFSPNYDYSGDPNFKAMASMTSRKYGTSYTLKSNTYTRKGYQFIGWNTKKDGSGKSYANGATVKNLSKTDGASVYLYAQWQRVVYVTATGSKYHEEWCPTLTSTARMITYDEAISHGYGACKVCH
ncbi:MAG: InlB B-repeat-containing protein [Lachnospiraceae bacterium]|nr:InlB B-repeat-containing protein [Lachnospiraceae bacterium]